MKPGYIVVGDEDGIVFIDPQDAQEIIRKTQILNANETAIFASIKAGTVDRSWVNKALQEKGCVIID